MMGKVTFTGSVTNVEDYMQAMDVFVFPSRFEGLGIVAIEAQASGLPVIASDYVTREAKISDMGFISLSSQTEQWADEILSLKSHLRKDNGTIIRNAGFDIRKTSDIIKTIYF